MLIDQIARDSAFDIVDLACCRELADAGCFGEDDTHTVNVLEKGGELEASVQVTR